MLLELSVSRIALIESLHLELHNGLCVFTGETGAGKSILLDAIGLLIGNRGSTDLIRSGAEDAIVEGTFSPGASATAAVADLLAEWGIDDSGSIVVLSRRLYRNGRTVCRINGQMSTVQMLREIGSLLIQQHGQHEHQSLLHTDEQLRLVDNYGHHMEQIKEVQELYHQWKLAARKYADAQVNEDERARRIDMLVFQMNEIEKARLELGEEEELRQEKSRLMHTEKIAEAIQTALECLNGSQTRGAVAMIMEADHALQSALEFDDSLQPILDFFDTAQVHLDEANRELSELLAKLEADPNRLEEVDNRLALLRQLQRKYGPSVEAVLDYYHQISMEYRQYEHYDEELDKLREDMNAVEEELAKASQTLHDLRVEAAEKLAADLSEVLHELHMPHAFFDIQVQRRMAPGNSLEFGETGADTVNFLFSANKGTEAKPLSKIASGGELSRTMLAIKSVMAEADDVDTLIFDEVDSGVSGSAAQKVAEQLQKLSHHRQVLCVTHSPQIASAGNWHCRIEKRERDTDTVTELTLLNVNGRVKEVARLLGSAASDETALRHAEAMLQSFLSESQVSG